MINRQPIDDLLEAINKELRTKPLLLRVEEGKTNQEYVLFLGREPLKTVDLQQATDASEILHYIRQRKPSDYVSSEIISDASGKRYITLIPDRVFSLDKI